MTPYLLAENAGSRTGKIMKKVLHFEIENIFYKMVY